MYSSRTDEGVQPPVVDLPGVHTNVSFYFNQLCYGLKVEICNIFV